MAVKMSLQSPMFYPMFYKVSQLGAAEPRFL